MTVADTAAPAATTRTFLPLYALANAGGVISYMPILTLLVPLKVGTIAGAARLDLLSAVTVVGAIVASIANIAFGMASDRSFRRGRSRRGWIIGGLAAIALADAALAGARTPALLIGAIVLFQLAVNMLLAPLSALMADTVPDDRKGLAGGMLALAVPAASVVGAAVTAASGIAEPLRYALVAIVVAACVLPVLTVRMPAAVAHAGPRERRARGGDVLRLSIGRLLIQVASTGLFTYLLFYFETLPDGRGLSMLAPQIAGVTTVAFLIAAPLALVAGRWSDRVGRRKPFLLATAAAAAGGLVVMALRPDQVSAAIGYGLFAIGSTIFLGLQTAFVMQVLPSPATRGRDLGVVNLANTVPSLISAALAWGIVGRFGYAALFAVLAILVVLGGALTLSVRSED